MINHCPNLVLFWLFLLIMLSSLSFSAIEPPLFIHVSSCSYFCVNLVCLVLNFVNGLSFCMIDEFVYFCNVVVAPKSMKHRCTFHEWTVGHMFCRTAIIGCIILLNIINLHFFLYQFSSNFFLFKRQNDNRLLFVYLLCMFGMLLILLQGDA